MNRRRVGIVVFDEVEVLDFCGPFEVFAAVRLDEEQRRETASPFEVVLVAEKIRPIVAHGGLEVIPTHSFESCPRLDILVVPGGWGTRRELKNPVMLEWLKVRAAEAELVTSVCTGAMLLGFAGLLEGLSATTHWKSLDWMRDAFPGVRVSYDQHVVANERVITSAGISAGIDMALTVVARCCGEAAARATATHMEYPYPDSNARRVKLR
ncbi:MAG: DJ-1/PfpI family protein [Desulfobacteraceae bacterium]|nr:MAG: DJ-1/PfpI family protein [Desulfobacteraceae bacterium]